MKPDVLSDWQKQARGLSDEQLGHCKSTDAVHDLPHPGIMKVRLDVAMLADV